MKVEIVATSVDSGKVALLSSRSLSSNEDRRAPAIIESKRPSGMGMMPKTTVASRNEGSNFRMAKTDQGGQGPRFQSETKVVRAPMRERPTRCVSRADSRQRQLKAVREEVFLQEKRIEYRDSSTDKINAKKGRPLLNTSLTAD